MKSFNQESLLRILLQVEKPIAIGAIIKAEQSLEVHKQSELADLVGLAIEMFFSPLPDFIQNWLQEVFPDFFSLLSLYLAATFKKYLDLLPGETIDFDIYPARIMPEFEEPEEVVIPDISDVAQELLDTKDARILELERSVADYEERVRGLHEVYDSHISDIRKSRYTFSGDMLENSAYLAGVLWANSKFDYRL